MMRRRLSSFAFVSSCRGSRLSRYRDINARRWRDSADLWRVMMTEGWS